MSCAILLLDYVLSCALLLVFSGLKCRISVTQSSKYTWLKRITNQFLLPIFSFVYTVVKSLYILKILQMLRDCYRSLMLMELLLRINPSIWHERNSLVTHISFHKESSNKHTKIFTFFLFKLFIVKTISFDHSSNHQPLNNSTLWHFI